MWRCSTGTTCIQCRAYACHSCPTRRASDARGRSRRPPLPPILAFYRASTPRNSPRSSSGEYLSCRPCSTRRACSHYRASSLPPFPRLCPPSSNPPCRDPSVTQRYLRSTAAAARAMQCHPQWGRRARCVTSAPPSAEPQGAGHRS